MIWPRSQDPDILAIVDILSSIPIDHENLWLHVEIVYGSLLVTSIAYWLNWYIYAAPPDILDEKVSA